MKILFISNLFPDSAEPYRGLDNVTVLHHLRERGHEVRVLSPRPALKPRSYQPRGMDEVLAPRYINAPYAPKIGGLFNHRLMAAALRPALRRLRREWPWDIVLASWLFPDAWAAAHAAGAGPLTLIAQGSDAHVYLKSPPRRRAILEACARAGSIITRSGSLSVLLAEAGVAREKLHPVHNGVDTRVFHAGDPAEARAALGLPTEGRWLLFVGNLLPVKDPAFLLRAFQKIAAALPDTHLALAGRGPLRESLGTTAGELGISSRVRFLGPQDAAQIGTWMRAADLFCMTSRNEGLPNVILESQACGLPVVATDVGGIHEVVDEAWKGRLVPLDDLDAWVTAALGCLSQPTERGRLSQLGMARAWPHVAAIYEQHLQSALG